MPRRERVVERALAGNAFFDGHDGAALVGVDQRHVEPRTLLQELQIARAVGIDVGEAGEEAPRAPPRPISEVSPSPVLLWLPSGWTGDWQRCWRQMSPLLEAACRANRSVPGIISVKVFKQSVLHSSEITTWRWLVRGVPWPLISKAGDVQ